MRAARVRGVGAPQGAAAQRAVPPAAACGSGRGRTAAAAAGAGVWLSSKRVEHVARFASAACAAAEGGGRVEDAAPVTRQTRRAAAKPQAPYPKRGEKTADGMPKPDERTVADLVRRGWFATAEQAEAVLTKYRLADRFPFETAGPAADWLEARLASVPDKDGRCAAARAISTFPRVLTKSVEALQRGWDTLLRPQADGGLGYTPERAAQRVSTHPSSLSLTPEHVLETAAVLEECGVAVGIKAIAKQSTLLNLAATTLLEHAAWWKQTGLDYRKILTTQPVLLAISSDSSNKHLQDKLDFLSRVVGMSTEELNNAPGLFTLSLDGRLRARYFYALLKGKLARFTSMNTMMKETDATFLAMMQGGTTRERASDLEVARYQKLVASPKFAAWRQRREAQEMRRRAPK